VRTTFGAWFSPHDQLVFPHIVFTTYYGAGLRAVDISDPFRPIQVGFYLNKPVERVRWCSYGPCLPPVLRPDGLAREVPTFGPPDVFAFSYVDAYNGHIIYADVHSGLYILKYSGPHAEEVPEEGICLSGNAGGVEPGFEPCAPYGQTNWTVVPPR
jgi:hypothetical protein